MTVLSKCVDYWHKIGVSDQIKEWITNGVNIPFVSDPPECKFNNHAVNIEESKFIDNKLDEYLSKAYISEVPFKPKCVTPIGCVKKKAMKNTDLLTTCDL